MVVWPFLCVLLAATLVVLLKPLFRTSRFATGGDDSEVFAAQLDELAADRERGLIGDDEAEAARAEIARRLLRARGVTPAAAAPPARRFVVGGFVGLFIVLFSVAAYMTLGSPDYGDQPLAARVAPMEEEDLDVLIARAESELAESPDDGRGWAALAPIYQRLGRFADAAAAYANMNRLLGEKPEWLSLQAENLVYSGDGLVGPAAADLFERALKADPDLLRPAIFLAIAARQEGDLDAAEARWKTLLDKSDGSEPWLEIARAEYARMGREIPAKAVATAETPPPMVEAMVSGLAARLESEGGTPEEWIRLVRSYTVLGRTDEAKATVTAARAALTGEALATFDAAPDVQRLNP